jgi:hypothetical protein
MSATKLPAGSNWSKLKSKVVSTKKKDVAVPAKDEKSDMSDHLSEKLKANYVGLDCEMVGIGLDGKQSALARCCLVNYDGEVIYDEFVRPPGFVTDFRTKYSGVRKKDLRQGTAITLSEVAGLRLGCIVECVVDAPTSLCCVSFATVSDEGS